MNVNLHELANTGGFGRADEILKKSGHPKASDVDGKWSVDVEYSVSYTATVEVEAATEEEARKLAKEEVELCPDAGDREWLEIDSAKAKPLQP
jgi:hypothetical protein